MLKQNSRPTYSVDSRVTLRINQVAVAFSFHEGVHAEYV